MVSRRNYLVVRTVKAKETMVPARFNIEPFLKCSLFFRSISQTTKPLYKTMEPLAAHRGDVNGFLNNQALSGLLSFTGTNNCTPGAAYGCENSAYRL